MAGLVALVAVGVALVLVSRSERRGDDAAVGPAGVQHFTGLSRLHVRGPVEYEQTPPVGGDHAPIWQNCGFYSRPIEPALGVHSLEHGAVWITYRPGLDERQLERLRGLADDEYVLVTPWPSGLPAPVVASAWGRQLQLGSASDPRLGDFVEAYAAGAQAPERGAPCTGGEGVPE